MLNMREFSRVEPPFPKPERRASGAPTVPWARSGFPALGACAIVLGGLSFASLAPAIEIGQGEVQGSLDTTISHGITWRVERQEARARDFLSANSNDGNLNYGRGIVSNTSKFTSDLDLGYRNYGLFVRATGFLDFENEDGMGDRTDFGPEAADLLDHEVDILDAYVSGSFDVGDAALDIRVGSQVLNWGESTFIPNGINAFNRFDVAKLRLPGSELREALAPIPMASLSVAPTYNLSVEGFYQLDWEETVIDPVGSYFSSTDYVGPGAREAVIVHPDFRDFFEVFGNPGSNLDRGFGFGELTPAINADLQSYAVDHPQFGPIPLPQPVQPPFESDFMTVLRGPDREPSDSGQWGLALRYLAEDLNETEFGVYFANYHSRLPLLRARTGTRESIRAGLAAAGAVSADGSHTIRAVTGLVTPEVRERVMAGVRAGLVPPEAAPTLIAEEVQKQVGALVGGVGAALAIDRYAETGYYFQEYPENVRLLGLSFNTALGVSGWALQGDYALHLDAPLQRAEDDLIADGIGPIFTALVLAGCAGNPEGDDCPRNPVTGAVLSPLEILGILDGYIENHAPSDIRGYIRHDVSQIQATATKVFGPVLGADAFAFVAEAAVMHVHNMTSDRLEGPARASVLGDDVNGDDIPDGDADGDSTSWGYRMAARLDYNNAVGAVNLFPYVQWRHDVKGNSPAPSGQFSEGLTALTLGLRADYLSSWRADVGYTRFGGKRNTLRDRDFVTASINYSF